MMSSRQIPLLPLQVHSTNKSLFLTFETELHVEFTLRSYVSYVS